MRRNGGVLHFVNDVALGGAALALFALFQQFGSDIGLTAGPSALFD